MPEKKSQSAGSVEGPQKALEAQLAALTAQLAVMAARLEKLESVGSATPAAASATAARPAAAQPAVTPAVLAVVVSEPVEVAHEFSDELLLVLSAAVAAYLGKRPHIRAIRLHGSSAWAQQGRVFVQASHQLNVPHEA